MMKSWIRRKRNSLGFGVQSPNDFYFVRHVLRDEGHYYAYAPLRRMAEQCKDTLPGCGEPVYRMLFRLANHVHPDTMVEVGCGFTLLSLSMARLSGRCVGITSSVACVSALQPLLPECPRVELKNGDEMAVFCQLLHELGTVDLLHVAGTEYYREVVEAALPYTHNRSVIVIGGLRDSKEKYAWWRGLCASPHTGVSYDLGIMGLLFFDKTRYKDAYWIKLKH